jgi:hypothetical protein
VYASKSLEHLRTTGYARYGIHGEVNLWGTVVEHEQGWRAQFAYPKNLYLPLDILPFTLALERTRLRCSSMSSLIVTAFPTHGIHRNFHNRLENGASYQRFLVGCMPLASRGERSSIRRVPKLRQRRGRLAGNAAT